MKSFIRHSIFFLTACAVFFGASSCDIVALGESSLTEQQQSQQDDMLQVEFCIGSSGEAATRATGIVDSDESKINRWALFLYRKSDNALIEFASTTNSNSITASVPVGTYLCYAVVNYPTSGTGSFTPSYTVTKSSLESKISYLANNTRNNLVMCGSKEYTLTLGSNGTKSIPVYRLVSKIGVKKVSVDMTRPSDAAKTFVLKGIYITNAYSRSKFGSDYAASGLSATRSYWYNTMGWATSGSCTSPANPTAIIGETAINATIPNGSSHTTAHYFYAYPNATPSASDTRSATWSKRCTRMVIEATLGGTTYYYVVTLPATARNNTYIVEEAIIKRPGALHPEQDTYGAMDIVFSTSTDEWTSVAVNETS